MFKTILAATDQVVERDLVVDMGAKLAAANQGRLFILHVLESASTQNRGWVKHYETGEEFQCDKSYEVNIRQQLTATYQKAIDSAPMTQLQVATGYPWEEILHWARKAGADLIVMGPHSSRAFQKGVVRVAGKVGSTVQGVITREKCPTLIASEHLSKPVSRFGHILVGIDFSAACECALCFASQLAKFYSAKVTAFHMIPIPPYPKYTSRDFENDRRAACDRLSYFCREYLDGTEWSYHIRGGVLPHIALLQCAERIGADLIVLGSHTRQTEGKWYPGSAVERVSYRSNCPVMVINDPEALQPWKEMQKTLAEDDRPKDRHIHLFTGRT